METADRSIRYNESIGHGNIRKFINESDVGFDSGYASTSSSTYNVTASNNVSSESPVIGSVSHSSIPRKSLDLETIAENYESTFMENSPAPLNETPTTRSIRQISAFHITTPQNNRNVLETTPTKSNYFYNTRSANKSGQKKSRSIGSANRSPMQQILPTSQKKGNRFNLSFKEKLKSTDNLENEYLDMFEESADIENSFSISMVDPANELSPIGHHNRSAATTPRSKQRVSLQRHPSGIESSTPKHGPIKRSNPQTVAKSHFISSALGGILIFLMTLFSMCAIGYIFLIFLVGREDTLHKRSRLIRKTQSFSPAKRNSSVLKEISTNWQAVLERHEEQIEEEEELFNNPARKMLTFSANQFDTLVNKKIKGTETKAGNSIPKTKASEVKSSEMVSRLTAKARLSKQASNSNLFKQVSNSNLIASAKKLHSESIADFSFESIKESSITEKCTPSSCEVSLIKPESESPSDMDISVSTPASSSKTPAKSDSRAKNSNFSIKSNIDLLLNSPILIESPIRNRRSKQTIHESVQRKPMKKLERSTSLNPTISPRPNREFNSIIYERLPCTPPKPYKRKRRLSTDTILKDTSVSGPAAKRKLYDICPRPVSYMGFTYLDFLTQLQRTNTAPVIHKILGYLPDNDLLSAYMVSKSWADIISGNYAAKARRLKCLKIRRSSKENVPQASVSGVEDDKMISRRKPFTRQNINTGSRKEERSPPVSPSKRKFHENQKVFHLSYIIFFFFKFINVILFFVIWNNLGSPEIKTWPKINQMSTL